MSDRLDSLMGEHDLRNVGIRVRFSVEARVNRSEAGKLGWAASRGSQAQYQQRRRSNAEELFRQQAKQCPQCKTPLTFEQRANTFCGQTCSAAFNNAKRGRRGCCLECGAPVSPKRKFCSYRCTNMFRAFCILRKIEESGLAPNPVTAKKFLISRYGYRCALCAITEWRGDPLTLTLDHRDGDPYNNAIENLRMLCPNCHSQTPSYAGRNRGKGRVARRERDRVDYQRRCGRIG
jgi:predicted nucleic acid-binding Zn ribbon protein